MIPAGTRRPAPLLRSYPGIAAGSTCTVTETGNGASGRARCHRGQPANGGHSANGTGIANVTDTYSNVPIPVGSLTVTQEHNRPGGRPAGPVTVTASCNGRALSPTLDIPAGATGVHSQTYPNIPAGSVCSATAGPDGGTSTVQVSVHGRRPYSQHPGGRRRDVASQTLTHSLGASLVVTKTITGPAAGQQGAVTVQTVCNGSALSPELTVPAGAAAGIYSQTYGDIPAGSACTVHETANGATSTVSVTTTGAGQTVTVPVAHVAAADITDTYSPSRGLT